MLTVLRELWIEKFQSAHVRETSIFSTVIVNTLEFLFYIKKLHKVTVRFLLFRFSQEHFVRIDSFTINEIVNHHNDIALDCLKIFLFIK